MLRDFEDDYSDMKYKLMKWFKDNQDIRKQKNRKKFANARPREGESLYLFSIRMQNLFKLAFPKHNPERSETLIRQFKQAIPRAARNMLSTQIMSFKLKNEKPDWSFVQKCIRIRDLDEEIEIDSSDSEERTKEPAEVVINLGNTGRRYKQYRNHDNDLDHRHKYGSSKYNRGEGDEYGWDRNRTNYKDDERYGRKVSYGKDRYDDRYDNYQDVEIDDWSQVQRDDYADRNIRVEKNKQGDDNKRSQDFRNGDGKIREGNEDQSGRMNSFRYHRRNDGIVSQRRNAYNENLCFACKEPGHYAKDCPSNKVQCYRCGEMGHHAQNCQTDRPQGKVNDGSRQFEHQEGNGNQSSSSGRFSRHQNRIEAPHGLQDRSRNRSFSNNRYDSRVDGDGSYVRGFQRQRVGRDREQENFDQGNNEREFLN